MITILKNKEELKQYLEIHEDFFISYEELIKSDYWEIIEFVLNDENCTFCIIDDKEFGFKYKPFNNFLVSIVPY